MIEVSLRETRRVWLSSGCTRVASVADAVDSGAAVEVSPSALQDGASPRVASTSKAVVAKRGRRVVGLGYARFFFSMVSKF